MFVRRGVVGAGITGALIALELRTAGRRVVVDRRDIGGGSTSASTALLQYEIDELLIDTHHVARCRACGAGVHRVRARHRARRASHPGGRPELRVPPSPQRVHGDPHVGHPDLARECAARRAAGFDVQWLDQRLPLGSDGTRRSSRRWCIRRPVRAQLLRPRDGPSAGRRCSNEPR